MRPLVDVINALVWREIAGIQAIDSAVARQTDPGYTFLLNETKLEKQANVTQMTTLLRLHRLQPDFSTGLTGILLTVQASVLQALDTTATLRAMRTVGRELIQQYTVALDEIEGIAARTVRKALSRAIVQDTVLSAHIARRAADPAEERELPRALAAYFATSEAHVCMRCLLDRDGAPPALRRDEPRPHQYICRACHHEVFQDLPEDLRDQATRWPTDLREDRIIHRALSRPARVTALHEVLYPLSGLAAELPRPAADAATQIPAASPTPGPAADAPASVRTVESGETPENAYLTVLFDPARIRAHW